MRIVVNGLLIREGKILLALRSPFRSAYPSTWSFPGGHVEKNETRDQALIREIREEIGVIPSVYDFLAEIEDPNVPQSTPTTYYLYVISDWQGGEPWIANQEHTKLEWFAPQDAGKLEHLALSEYRMIFQKLSESLRQHDN